MKRLSIYSRIDRNLWYCPYLWQYCLSI